MSELINKDPIVLTIKDRERLVEEIVDAVCKKIVTGDLDTIRGPGEFISENEERKLNSDVTIENEILHEELSKFEFSNRVKRAFYENRIYRIGDLVSLNAAELSELKGVGESVEFEIRGFIDAKDLNFEMIPKAHWSLIGSGDLLNRIRKTKHLSKEIVLERRNGCISLIPLSVAYKPVEKAEIGTRETRKLIDIGVRYVGDLGALDIKMIERKFGGKMVKRITLVLLQHCLEHECFDETSWISRIDEDFKFRRHLK